MSPLVSLPNVLGNVSLFTQLLSQEMQSDSVVDTGGVLNRHDFL